MVVRLVLDTDIGTDVDDALALAFALRHPDIELRAVTTVSGDTRARARIAAKLLRLAGRDDVEVAAGLDSGPPPVGRSAWGGHEGEGLLGPGDDPPISSSDAVAVLLDATREPDTEIATIGMQTNIAAALERDHAFANRVGLLGVMGGVFARARATSRRAFTPADDHNLNVDPHAAVAALNAGIPTLYVPGDVTVQTSLTTAHVDRLRHGDALCQALADLTDRWTPILRRRHPDLPAEQTAALHDPLTVATMVDRRFVATERLPVTVAVHDGVVRTFVDPVAGHAAEVVTAVAAADFANFWLETVVTC